MAATDTFEGLTHLAARVNPPVRVTHLTSAHPALDGRIFFKECRTLSKAGYDVTVVGRHERSTSVDGVKIVGVPAAATRVRRMTWGILRTYLAAARTKADVFHLHDPELLLVAPLLRLQKAKVVFDMHENMPKAILTKPWIPRSLRPLVAGAFRLVERILTSGLWIVFAESSYSDDYPTTRRTVTVLNYPQLNRLAGASRPNTARRCAIVYVGAVSNDRGCRTMLGAVEKLVQLGEDIVLELVGSIDEDCLAEMRAVQARIGEDRIRYHGILPQTEAWAIAATCRAGLAVLRGVPNYVDSYPTKIFEYMALGLPVICSDFPLYRQVVEDSGAGFCVPPDDVTALVAIVRRLLHDEALVTQIGSNGRRTVHERYDWESQGEQLVRFYRRMIGGERADVLQQRAPSP